MNINHVNIINTRKNNLNPSFGSLRVCQGKIYKLLADGTKRTVDVEIHHLRAEDVSDVQRFSEDWKYTTTLGGAIINHFLKTISKKETASASKCGVDFFALKPVDATEFGSTDPICLAGVRRGKDGIGLCYLQTADSYLHKYEDREISGCGEMLVYGISKIISETKATKFIITCVTKSKKFYEKIFKTTTNSPNDLVFKLSLDDINGFIGRTEEKYGLLKGMQLSESVMQDLAKNTHMV